MSFLYAVKYKQHTTTDRGWLKIEHLHKLSSFMWKFIICNLLQIK